jgi:hypothetical protein
VYRKFAFKCAACTAYIEERHIDAGSYEATDEVPLESMQFLKDSLVVADTAGLYKLTPP